MYRYEALYGKPLIAWHVTPVERQCYSLDPLVRGGLVDLGDHDNQMLLRSVEARGNGRISGSNRWRMAH